MSTDALKLAASVLKGSQEYKRGHTTFVEAVEEIEAALAQPQPEPVAWVRWEWNRSGLKSLVFEKPEELSLAETATGVVYDPLYTSPPARKPLTAREIELLDGMIEVQLDHAARCDNIANRVMAEKQKGWDMERVELLRKLKGDA